MMLTDDELKALLPTDFEIQIFTREEVLKYMRAALQAANNKRQAAWNTVCIVAGEDDVVPSGLLDEIDQVVELRQDFRLRGHRIEKLYFTERVVQTIAIAGMKKFWPVLLSAAQEQGVHWTSHCWKIRGTTVEPMFDVSKDLSKYI